MESGSRWRIATSLGWVHLLLRDAVDAFTKPSELLEPEVARTSLLFELPHSREAQRAVGEVANQLRGASFVGPPIPPSQVQVAELERLLVDELRAQRLLIGFEPFAGAVRARDPIELDLPPLGPAARTEPETSFIAVHLTDQDGAPVVGRRFRIELPDGSIHEGATDINGFGRVQGFTQDGTAKITFLNIDELDFKTKNGATRLVIPVEEQHVDAATDEEDETASPTPENALDPALLDLTAPPKIGKLFVELFDKTGRVRHAKRTFQITGPQTFAGTTDDQGRLELADVPAGDYSLSLALDFFLGDPDATVDIMDTPLVVLAPQASDPQVRLIGAVPRSVLARLHAGFNTNKAFLLPTALPSLRLLRKLYLQNSPGKLLVVGHADTKGTPQYNEELSLERANAAIAYLKDDVDAWLAFYDHSDPKRRWGKVEDHLMIIALPDFRDKPPKEKEVEFFQRTRGLQVDGTAGSDTRRALVEEYMSLDGTSLADFVGEIDAIAHGCGENFPLDDRGEGLDQAPEDEKRDHLDRRVEFFFFDTEFGVTPPPPSDTSKAGSLEYPKWRARAVETHDLEVDSTGAKLQLVEFEDVLFDTNSAVPLPQPCRADGSLDPKGPSAVHDLAAALRFAFCYPGKLLLVAGHADTTADAKINDPLSEKRAINVLSLLVGDRATFATTADAQHVPSDIVRILDWADACFGLLCAPKRFKGNMDAAIRSFQTSYNGSDRGGNLTAPTIGVDGDFGPETWGAVFDLYEGQLVEVLQGDRELLAEYRKDLTFVDDNKRSMGFGERYPVDELGRDNIRSAANRRVEVLFFDAKDSPDLDAALDASPIYLPGTFVHEPQPFDPAALEVQPIGAVRLPTRFSNARTFPKPSALPALSKMAKLGSSGHTRLVIVGHTDHTQKNAENEALSLARAEAVSALLRHDRDFFLKRFDEADPMTVWKWEEVQWMLSAIKRGDERCYVGFVDGVPSDLTRRALGQFQMFSEDLEVDYDCNAATLSQMIDAYFALLDAPPVPAERITTVAGGSWNVQRAFQADAALQDSPTDLSSTNRRVDVFAFDQPIVPPPDTVVPATRQESPTYVRWCRSVRTVETSDPVPFPIRLFDQGLVPIGSVSISMARFDDSTGTFGAAVTLPVSEFGTAEFVGAVGTYGMSFSAQGRSFDFGLSVQPDEIGGFAAIITHDLA